MNPVGIASMLIVCEECGEYRSAGLCVGYDDGEPVYICETCAELAEIDNYYQGQADELDRTAGLVGKGKPMPNCPECGGDSDGKCSSCHEEEWWEPLTTIHREEVVSLNAEIKRLTQWVHDCQSGMWINCVYCGHRYGPEDEVQATMQETLYEHIASCPKHPLSKANAALKAIADAWEPDGNRGMTRLEMIAMARRALGLSVPSRDDD